MLEREISKYLLEWKNKKDKLPLVIRGARQVGKTYIVQKFGEKYYKSIVYINFEKDVELKEVFNGNLSVDEIISKIKIVKPEYNFIPYDTLIFFDEIQNGGNCRTSLKFFAIDKRYDVICSGSLLGLYHKEVSSFPVGYVENIEMQSLNFFEFCKGLGIEDEIFFTLKNCYENKTKVDDFLHKKMLEYFNKYIIIGGMPQAINKYLETNDYIETEKIKKDIILLYRDDIAKYTKYSEKEKVLACFDSIPRHLSNDYKKFKYSLIEEKASSRKYAGALEYLYDAGIINYCYDISRIEFPFEGYVLDNMFKVYMRDTGLLVTTLGSDIITEILNGNLGIFKGAIYENIIGEVLSKLGKKLYYYQKDNRLEIDFIINYNNKPTLLEVKSSENTKSKSVKTLLENKTVDYAIKLSRKNLTHSEKILNFPIYMSVFL